MSFFTNHLRDEHKEIKEKINDLKNFEPTRLDKLQDLLCFFEDFVEKKHHAKEELLLFPTLYAGEHMKQGGPRCTYFMEFKLLHNDSLKINRETLSKSNSEILKTQSPLSIPLKEHMVCAQNLNSIKKLVENSETEKLTKLITHYIHLLELHIEKEDTCLFVQADKCLSSEIQKKLLEEALLLESQIK